VAVADDKRWLRGITNHLTVLTRALSQPRQAARIGKRSGVALQPHLYVVFTRIGECQPIRGRDLAEYTELDRSTISRTVADLVDAGLVDRGTDPLDARNMVLSLTPTGQDALGRLWSAWHEELATAMSDWTETERNTFAILLSRLAVTMERQVWDGQPPWRSESGASALVSDRRGMALPAGRFG
jgi:DNA-binding MarR family transcriptional regulator